MGRITIAGTTVDAPVYYGDTNSILNRGVGYLCGQQQEQAPW